jgi:hypothetical protein
MYLALRLIAYAALIALLVLVAVRAGWAAWMFASLFTEGTMPRPLAGAVIAGLIYVFWPKRKSTRPER